MRSVFFQAVVCAGSLFCGCANSCAQGQEPIPAHKTDVFSPLSVDQLARLYPRPDAYLGEALQPGEIEAVAGLIATLAGNIQNNYAAGSAKRDAHPKAHGCVDATLDITKDLS